MKLTHEEVNELIGKYKSELRKLAYQQQNLSGIIKNLEGQSKAAPKRRGRPAKAKAAAPKAAPKRRGRPAKAKVAAPKAAPKRRGRPAKAKVAAPKAAPKRRGRPAKAKVAAPKAAPKRRGRPAKAKAAAPKKAPAKVAAKKPAAAAKKGYRLSEWDNLVMKTLNDRKKVSVFADFMATAKAGGSKLSDQDIYRRINQSLHKLANKRKELVKVPQKGRGFGYALTGWKK